MLRYRKIEAADNEQLAKIIRNNLEKFHLNIPGTVYFDSQLDYLSEYYNDDTKNRVYFVALDEENQVIGGVGLAEFEVFSDCAEIQKLYLEDSTKGKGYGKELMKIAEEWAKEAGCKCQHTFVQKVENIFVQLPLLCFSLLSLQIGSFILQTI